MGIKIRVVGMKQRPIGHWPGQIGRKPAARRKNCVHRLYAPVVVIPDRIIDNEIVPLAGGDHIVVAVGPDLDGTIEFLCGDCRHGGKQIALGFLAPEPAAHAAHHDIDRVGRHAQRMAHHMLDLAGVLGRGMDGDLIVLTGDRQCDMPFEIEMVLTAHFHCAGHPMFRRCHARRHVTTLELHARRHQRSAGLARRTDIERERQFGIAHLCQFRRAPCRFARCRNHRKQRLAEKLDFRFSKDRLVMLAGLGNVIMPGHIVSCEHPHHARRLPHGFKRQRPDLSMGSGGKPQIGMQRTCRLEHIVDILGHPRHVLVPGIMLLRHMHTAANGGFVVERGHHATSCRMIWLGPSTVSK